LDKITKQDRYFLQTFNFYNKNIDFNKLQTSRAKIFKIEKTAKSQSTDDSVINKNHINTSSEPVDNLDTINNEDRLKDDLNNINNYLELIKIVKLICINNTIIEDVLKNNFFVFRSLINLARYSQVGMYLS
jgi:hypothetical protein